MTTNILYISNDGMLESLWQPQVLAYLEHIAVGRRIHLISFEKSGDWANISERELVYQFIDCAGMLWYPLLYRKRPSALATLWGIVCGSALGLWLVLRYKLYIVHARSYVSMVMALVLKRLTDAKLLFDTRCFRAGELSDHGLWSRTRCMCRVAKVFAKRCLLTSCNLSQLQFEKGWNAAQQLKVTLFNA